MGMSESFIENSYFEWRDYKREGGGNERRVEGGGWKEGRRGGRRGGEERGKKGREKIFVICRKL